MNECAFCGQEVAGNICECCGSGKDKRARFMQTAEDADAIDNYTATLKDNFHVVPNLLRGFEILRESMFLIVKSAVTYAQAEQLAIAAMRATSKTLIITEKEGNVDQLQNVADFILDNGWADGAHHKQWVLDQVLRLALGSDYDRIVAEAERAGDPDEYCEWDRGVAP